MGVSGQIETPAALPEQKPIPIKVTVKLKTNTPSNQ
jgi:hypothetical protein